MRTLIISVVICCQLLAFTYVKARYDIECMRQTLLAWQNADVIAERSCAEVEVHSTRPVGQGFFHRSEMEANLDNLDGDAHSVQSFPHTRPLTPIKHHHSLDVFMPRISHCPP